MELLDEKLVLSGVEPEVVVATKSSVAAPSNETAKRLPVLPHIDSPPLIAPSAPKFNGHSHHTSPSTTPPPDSTPSDVHHHSSSSPPTLYHRHHQDRKRITCSAAPSPPPTPKKLNRKGSMTLPP